MVNNKPKEWLKLKFDETVVKIPTSKNKIKQKEYIENGTLAVVDQGQDFIGGYTNDLTKAIECNLPVIVFGDHTKVVKLINFKFAAGADGVKVLKPEVYYDIKLFTYFLNVLVKNIVNKGYARHYQFLEKENIYLPPLAEQKEIIKRIEELFSDLDNGVENLKKAKEQIKIYRQSVLKNAFEGKLTEKWREENFDKLESPEVLLAKIKRAREEHYQKQMEEWKQKVKEWEEKGKEGKKPNKPKKLDEPKVLENEELIEYPILPKNWIYIRLGNATYSVKDGPHYSPKYEDVGIPFISGGNIRANGIDFINVKYISENLHKELSQRCKPEVGDVLYTKGGTTGIARVNTYSLDFNVWVHVAVLKISNIFKPFFIQHNLNSPRSYKQSQKYTHGVGNQDLGLTRMVKIVMSVCSLEEQEQVIQEIESKLSVCDKMEEVIDESLKKAELLRQSILKRAFSGELTKEWRKNNPDLITGENSAENLLKKIKAEKELINTKTKKRKMN